MIAVEPVLAQCVEGTPSGGRTPVSCTGTDADGYAAAVDDVDVTVDAGATVDEGAADEAILLLNGSTVVNDGTITATAASTQGIEAGDNATIDNQGVGEIRADGAGGIAVLFSGTDDTANNVLNNSGDGVIDTAGSVAVQGSVGNEEVTLSDDSMLTGDINLGAGDDGVTMTENATATGNADLGDGTNTFDISNEAELTGTITGGAGDDTVTINNTATVGGNIILGDGMNSLTINDTVTYSANFTGGADTDSVTISADATVSGTFDLGDGDNDLTLGGGGTTTTFTGSIDGGSGIDLITLEIEARFGTDISASEIDLGAGDDSLDIGNDSVVEADVFLGGGSDEIRVRTPLIEDGVTTFNGIIDLGVADDVADDANTVTIGSDAVVTGSVLGGLGDDFVEVRPAAIVDGEISLGGGDDTVRVGGGTTVGAITFSDGTNIVETFSDNDPPITRTIIGGIITGGAGVDTVLIDDMVDVEDDIILNGDADVFQLIGGGSVDGDVNMGDGDDVVIYDFRDDPDDAMDFGVSGIIMLGDGNNTFRLRPASTLPSSTDLTGGVDTDTLQLDSLPSAPTIPTGIANLSTATEFDALLIGPDDQASGVLWLVSTDVGDPAEFPSDITLQAGALVFDGKVELEGQFTHRRETAALPTTQAPRMVFDLGLGNEDVTNGQLDLDGELILEERDDNGTPMDLDDDREGASFDVTFTSTIVEDEYTLIIASDGITGEFDTETFPESGVFTFSSEILPGDDLMDPDDEKLVLTILREFFYDDGARTSSEARVGQYLDEARRRAGAGTFSEITNALDVLSTNDLRTALAQTSPEVYDTHTSSVVSWGRMQQRVLQQRSMRCDRFTYSPRPEIVSDSPCGSKGVMPWAKIVGDIASHKGGESRGYDTFGGGVLLGLDHRWNDELWLSADMGFGRVEIEHDNGADGQFDTIDLGVAAGTEIFGITTRGSFTYSHGFHETVRKIDFVSDRTKSKHDSDRVSLAAGAGYRLAAGPFVFEPNATIDYTHVEEESVDESGSDLVGLDVSKRKTDVFSATGGVRMGTNFLKYRYAGDWLEWADGVWSPNVSVQWRQGFGDVDRDQKAEMQGAPSGTGSFKSKAKDSNGGVEVGGHLSFQPLNTATSVDVGYDGYFGDDVTNHSANVSVRVPF